ncbi:MAG: ATP-binding cassette domain-containing protein, partial [Elusimicrobia bacterium]|nr:ATP-binding cassette domain-containing protein [Elusimicrobiota bacterium]
MIEVKGLQKTYSMGEAVVPALRGVSLSIEEGEFLAVMGPSGSGKSTLMHLLGLLDMPDSGSYKLIGKEVSLLSEDECASLRARTIGFVFQQFNLLARTSALENVALPTIYSGSKGGTDRPKILLEQVGLTGRAGHKPNELSGGQQQRVAIARSLINHPKIIFADEPTGNLDSKSQEEIMRIFSRLNEEGMTIILVTHEEEVARHAHRIIHMRDGLILSDTSNAEPLASGSLLTLTKPAAKVQETVSWTAQKSTGYSRFEASEHLKQAWRSLSGNKVRTGLSMLGILIGVASVIAMLALG